MINRKFAFYAAGLTAVLIALSAQAAWWSFSNDDEATSPQQQIAEIEWEDLIPEGFIAPENPFITMPQDEIDRLMDGSDESNAEIARLEELFNHAPVNPEMDGRRVKIPAYITPLEFNGASMIKEFLLVPYVGACIHVPPPPANQIVYVKSPEAIEFNGMYEPVFAIGVIRTETVKSDLAESGYRLEVEQVLPYSARERDYTQ